MTKFHTERLWVLIADGEHARVVTPVVAAGQFTTVVTFDSESAHLRSSDMGTERPGRVHESANTTRHAITPRSDPHTNAKHHFIGEVAKHIDQHALRHEFARLVLVAPPSALHDLRAALGKAAMGMVVGSLNKDLAKLNDHDLVSHLAEWWTAPAGAAV
jgi:protein required for attachment to host cells